tara:strand:+ start:659 stop:1486 length:828 start_codon:yes stop_codon:yes gene_type:complete
MNLSIGTGGLNQNFDETYWKIFLRAIEKEYHIHTDLKYENVDQYFKKAYLENIKIKKVIIKIEINKNPIKKIINIPKQINLILERFKIECIDTVQICNNPNANNFNMYLLKSILKKYKKKNIINNFFLECFDPFSKNLNKLINDNFFQGYIFKLNCLQRSTSKSFFLNILNSKKKIISISPYVGGKFEEVMGSFDKKLKIDLDYIMSSNGLSNYNSLNLAFLNSVNNMHSAIFGTKNFDRLKDIEKSIQEIKPLKKDDFFKILTLQDQFKSHISF